MEFLAITLRDGRGWQKRLFFQKASRKDLQSLALETEKLALAGASPEEILTQARSLAQEGGWQEVAH